MFRCGMIKKDTTLSIRIEGKLKRRMKREAKRRKLSLAEFVAQEMDRIVP